MSDKKPMGARVDPYAFEACQCENKWCLTCGKVIPDAQAENERLRSALQVIEALGEDACGEDATESATESMMSAWLEARAALRTGKDGQ